MDSIKYILLGVLNAIIVSTICIVTPYKEKFWVGYILMLILLAEMDFFIVNRFFMKTNFRPSKKRVLVAFLSMFMTCLMTSNLEWLVVFTKEEIVSDNDAMFENYIIFEVQTFLIVTVILLSAFGICYARKETPKGAGVDN